MLRLLQRLVDFLFGNVKSYVGYIDPRTSEQMMADREQEWEKDKQEEKLRLWDAITDTKGKCPKCKTGQLYEGPSGGMAINLICDNCNTTYWWSSERAFGAEEM